MPISDFITTAFNIDEQDIESLNAIFSNEILTVKITLKRKQYYCPYCGGDTVSKGFKVTQIHLTDIASANTIIVFNKRRYICKDCKKTFMEKNPFGPDNTNISWLTLQGILNDIRNLNFTYENIAKKYHISSTRVQLYVDSFLRFPNVPLSESIGIDELCSDMAKYSGKYLGVIVDNVNRDLIDILPNRNKVTFQRYFSNIPRHERLKVKYVTCDLWETYRDIAHTYLPNAKVCADPFHVYKVINDAFSKLRVKVMNNQIYDSNAYYLLKNFWKLLESDKYDVSLDAAGKYNRRFECYLNYGQILNMILSIDISLKVAYELKEEFRRYIKEANSDNAREEFNRIVKLFIKSNITAYSDSIKTLLRWKEEINNSFDRPYDNRKQSNSLAENINERIRISINISYGISCFERFRSRIIFALSKHIQCIVVDTFRSFARKGNARGKYKKQ